MRRKSAWRRFLGAAAVIGLSLGILMLGLIIVYALNANGLTEAGDWAKLATPVLAVVVPLFKPVVNWTRRPPESLANVTTPEQATNARQLLATLVLEEWQREIEFRGLDDPAPLAVRWKLTELPVMDLGGGLSEAGPLKRLLRQGRQRFNGRTDRIGEIADQFRELNSRRLVILGDPGMGKTTLAVLLMRRLLSELKEDDPVPVLFTLSDWDPRREALREWLARRLGKAYPNLYARDFGLNAPHALVARRQILPVLDGLDEISEKLRLEVIKALNAGTGERDALILTCRTAEYEQAVTAPGGDVLTSGAVIEAQPVEPGDVVAFLRRCVPPAGRDRWEHLIREVKNRPNGRLARTFSTPLALWLVREVYVETQADPSPLSDDRRFPTPRDTTVHLMDHLVESLLKSNPPRRGDAGRNPFRPLRSWNVDQAGRCLAFVARQMTERGTSDLAWWRLTLSNDISERAVRIFLGLALGIGGGLCYWPINGPQYGLLAGVCGGLVVGLMRTAPPGWRTGLMYALSFGTAYGGVITIATGRLVTGTANIAVLGLVYGLIGFLWGGPPAGEDAEPARVELRWKGRLGLLRRELEAGLTAGAKRGFQLGVPLGLILCLTFVASGSPINEGDSLTDTMQTLLLGMPLAGAIIGAFFGLGLGFTRWSMIPMVDDDRQGLPRRTLVADLKSCLLRAVTVGLLVGGFFGTSFSLTGGDVGRGVSGGVALGLMAASATLVSAPCMTYFVTTAILAMRRGCPFRLMAFLSDAHRLGILRQVGPVYQFRHAQIQERLAQRARP
ncbi:NACHT domain-containing protein [Actinomadura fulvescens]